VKAELGDTSDSAAEGMGGLCMLSDCDGVETDCDGVEIGICGGEPMLIEFGGVQPNILRTG
jgi:hypothetical protein